MDKTSAVGASPFIATPEIKECFELDEKIHKITQSIFYQCFQCFGVGTEKLIEYENKKNKILETLSTTEATNATDPRAYIELALKLNRDIKDTTESWRYQLLRIGNDKLESSITELTKLSSSDTTLLNPNLISTIHLVYQKTIHPIRFTPNSSLYTIASTLKKSLSSDQIDYNSSISDTKFSSNWMKEPEYSFNLIIGSQTINLTGAGLNTDGSLKACGGFGRVFFGTDENGKEIAVKVAKKTPYDKDMSRLTREADFLLRMQGSSNVLSASQVGFEGEYMFVVMDKLEGMDLYDAMKNEKAPLTNQDKIKILLGVAKGLKELHAKGILHRDIKPENIWVNSSGEAIVLDLGLSSLISEKPKNFHGTMRYMAIEAFKGEEQGTPTDVYALGLLIHKLFTNKILGEDKTKPEKHPYRHRTHNLTIPPGKSSRYMQNKVFYDSLSALTELCLKVKQEDRITVDNLITGLETLSQLLTYQETNP